MRRGLRLILNGATVAALGAGTLALQAPVAGASSGNGGGVNNPYSPAYGHPYRHGAVPTVAQNQQMRAYAASHQASTLSTGPETLAFGGGIDGSGVTSSTPKVYLVFWGSQWGTAGTDSNGNTTFTNDPSHGAPYLQQLFKGLGTNNELWSGTMTQYCDGSLVALGATSCPTGAPLIAYPAGGDLAGVWYDNSAAEPSAASGHQIGVEAVNAAGHFGNTTAASNRYAQYVILSATGLNPDNYKTQGFCAWHDYNGDTTLSGGAVSSPYGDIAFTNMPYVMNLGASCGQGFVNSPGTLDGYSIVEGHEYAETITDQNPAGGWTNHQNNAYGGEENGDECAWISSGQGASADVTTATGTFAMQSTWSNDTNRCDISHAIVTNAPVNDFSISDSPASGSVNSGQSAVTTVSTALTSGSSQTISLSASGLPAGTTATFGQNSVTSGGSTSLTLATTSSTPTGSYFVTITGTGTSATHSTTYNLSVTGNDFSISDNPTSGGVNAGQSAITTVSTSLTTGSAQTINLTASGLPAGATATFGQNSVTSGGSTSLTLATSTSTPGGSYTVTITGTGQSATHSTTYALSVVGTGGPNVISNGGFESGFTGWTRSGTTSLYSPGHTGTYAAEAGASSPTNGTSSVSQSFTAGSGDTTVRFSYDVVCPDTVQYDWATATLRDNTTGRTVTVLPRTCVSNSGWQLVSASLTAGHRYTLTLTNRDDNYPGDPTYTLFDDVYTR